MDVLTTLGIAFVATQITCTTAVLTIGITLAKAGLGGDLRQRLLVAVPELADR